RTWSASSAARTRCCGRWSDYRNSSGGRARGGGRATANTNLAGTPPRTCTNFSPSPRRSPRRAPPPKGAPAATFPAHFPDKAAAFGKVNLVVRKGPDGQMQLEQVPIPEMPAELKQIIEENK